MSAALERRLRQLRSRVLVRNWDYRQRHHARGVWFRLRRLLAGAESAFAVAFPEAEKLMQAGARREPVGDQLEPHRLILFAAAEQVARIESARSLPVRLSAELLAADCLVLVPFQTGSGLES